MSSQLFRIFVYNQRAGKAAALLHELQHYAGVSELAGAVELQGYDLCLALPETAGSPECPDCGDIVSRFAELQLADPVCDRHLIQAFSGQPEYLGTKPGESACRSAWQSLLPEISEFTKHIAAGAQPSCLAYEMPAAQFDPRAQAVQDCWTLWSREWAAGVQLHSVRCFWLYVLMPKPSGSSQAECRLSPGRLHSMHRYLWAPLELEVKDLRKFSYSAREQADCRVAAESESNDGSLGSAAGELPYEVILPSLTGLHPEAQVLRTWADQIGLRFDDANLAYIHAYYSGQELSGLTALAEPREPTLTELRILEVYWSDHCRHTTFHTELNWEMGEQTPETVARPELPAELKAAWNLYQDLRQKCGIAQRPQNLMDIATLGARALKTLQPGPYMDAVEISAEVNACSVFVDAEAGRDEHSEAKSRRRLLMFKNETHNHPTEIEPYGGAATCLGGAIRDPLSGRSYVYQALRLSGAASPNQRQANIRSGKLPQRKIASEAARGFSDYGNRIGLASNLVIELYHHGFAAKRFECGMVVGVARPEQVRRLEPQPGDLILLLGGATGRDGIGGALGSSRAHSRDTVISNAAEVQRGNPIEERKLQRFFRRSDVGHLIKRCNDFGAGGVAVAVGEIARGLELELAAMPTKYQGLRPDELAVSESQERMAVVIAAADWQTFREKAESEGIAVVRLGCVTAQRSPAGGPPVFRLLYRGRQIAQLARDFLDSSGFARRAEVRFAPEHLRPYEPEEFSRLWRTAGRKLDQSLAQADSSPDTSIEARLCEILRHPQVAGQRGLQHMFDSSVGASTLFQPYPRQQPADTEETDWQEIERTYGRSEVSAQLIPLHFWGRGSERAQDYSYRESRHASLISWAYDPYLSSENSFLGAQVAIVQSAAKLLAAGAERRHIYLSLQEYFPRLDTPQLWGQISAAMLGVLTAQQQLGLAAIGGKDSMSGSFEDLRVPPVLSSFAFGSAPCRALRPAGWLPSARHLYLLCRPQSSFKPLQSPDYERIRQYWEYLEGLPESGQVSTRLVGAEGVLAALALLAFGSAPKRALLKVYESTFLLPYAADPGFSAMLLASSTALPESPQLRKIADLIDCALGEEAIVWPQQFSQKGIPQQQLGLSARSPAYRAWCHWQKEPGYYPVDSASDRRASDQQRELLREARQRPAPELSCYKEQLQPPALRLVVPVFPGSNSEDDMLHSFAMAAEKLQNELQQELQLELCSPVINLLSEHSMQQSLKLLAELLDGARILALPGGFSASDEPDGSAKFIASVLREPQVARAIDRLLAGNGLILGICNGFQALIKCGLLPYGRDWQQGAAYGREGLGITHNRQGRHIADLELCRVCPTPSPWLRGMSGRDFLLPVSHGEGRLLLPPALLKRLRQQQQIAAVYREDINGSAAGIEALCSADGRILGKMAHSERRGSQLYRNVAQAAGSGSSNAVSLNQDIFINGLRYFC